MKIIEPLKTKHQIHNFQYQNTIGFHIDYNGETISGYYKSGIVVSGLKPSFEAAASLGKHNPFTKGANLSKEEYF